MLVLSRKKNESLVINDDITIVIVEIRGDKVRLGVEAPKEVPVHRGEVYAAIRRDWQYRVDSASDSAEAEYTPPAAPATWAIVEPLPIASPVAVAEVERHLADGLVCPQCKSDDVRVERIKVAYQGAELVRWRECAACGNRFQTLERVAEL